MSKLTAPSNVRYAEIRAVKITADGREIPLGRLAVSHPNPILNAWHQLAARIERRYLAWRYR